MGKMENTEKIYCEQCKNVNDTTVKNIKEEYPVKNESIVIEANVRCCAVCGEALWDNELDGANLKKAYAVFKEQNGLLSSDQIKRIRNKYGLSQRAFAKLLGVGEKTITRYENGAIQDKAQDNLIRLMDDEKIFEKLAKLNQGEIGSKKTKQLEAQLG
jgi:putative zinc finger/helix-turn-helix YgiT family protein